MKEKFVQAEVLELETGITETWNVGIGQTYDRGPAGTLVKKESRQQVDDLRGALDYVQPRFPVKEALDLLDQNVWHTRCIRLKAKLTVGLGYDIVHAEDPDAQPDAMYDRIKAWLKRPNPRYRIETFQRMMDKFAIDYFSLGNAYFETAMQLDNEIKELYHVRSETMRRGQEIRNGQYFQVLNPKQTVAFNTFGDPARDKSKTDIIHYYEYDPKDDYYGIPGWYPALADILMDRSTVEYMISTFRNQLVAKFMIVVEGGRLSNAAKLTLRDFLKKNATGIQNAGTTLVLDTDDPAVKIRIEKLEVSFGEKGSIFKDNRADARDHIIAAHGVLPRLLGVMSAGQLGGGGEAAAQLASFYEIEILPEQVRIEDMLNNTIFESFGSDNPWRIDFNEMDTSDIEKLSSAIEKLVGQPVLDVNEGREKLGVKRWDEEQLRAREMQQTTAALEKIRKSIESNEKTRAVSL